MVFIFLSMPSELQLEIIDNITRYSDLKILCLVSQHFYDTIIPQIYYKVDLRLKKDYGPEKYLNLSLTNEKDKNLKPRIKSLLSQPKNLGHVRILKTGQFGVEPTCLMKQLLPLFPKDFMLKFGFSAQSRNSFPTPRQIRFLWHCQKNLRNLKFYSYMVSWLEKFLEKQKQNQTDFLLGNVH